MIQHLDVVLYLKNIRPRLNTTKENDIIFKSSAYNLMEVLRCTGFCLYTLSFGLTAVISMKFGFRILESYSCVSCSLYAIVVI